MPRKKILKNLNKLMRSTFFILLFIFIIFIFIGRWWFGSWERVVDETIGYVIGFLGLGIVLTFVGWTSGKKIV